MITYSMKHLLIKELDKDRYYLMKRLSDGSEEVLYQGRSYCECLMRPANRLLRKYAGAASAAKEQRPI